MGNLEVHQFSAIVLSLQTNGIICFEEIWKLLTLRLVVLKLWKEAEMCMYVHTIQKMAGFRLFDKHSFLLVSEKIGNVQAIDFLFIEFLG